MTKKLEQQIERTKAKIVRLEKVLNADTIPGWAVTGGSNRSQSLVKALDRQNEKHIDAAVAWKQATEDLRFLEAKLANYRAGETYANGQVRKDAPSRVKRQKTEDLYAEFIKTLLQPGGKVAIAFNPDYPIDIVRVNKTTITSDHGTKWKFSELIPLNSDGKAMNEAELRQAVRDWQNG